ncbi:MAG: ATP-binding protein [bacterium]
MTEEIFKENPSIQEIHLQAECERLKAHISDGEKRYSKEQDWFNSQIAEIQKLADVRVLEKDKEIESLNNQIRELRKDIDVQFDKSLKKVHEMQSIWHLQETLLKKRSDIEAEALDRETKFTREKGAWLKQVEEMKNHTCEALKNVEQEYLRKRQAIEQESAQTAEELNRREQVLQAKNDELIIQVEKFNKEKEEITNKLIDIGRKLDEEAKKPKFNPPPGSIIPLVKESMENSSFPELVHALMGYTASLISAYIQKLPEKYHQELVPVTEAVTKGLDDVIKLLEPTILSTQHLSLQLVVDETLARFEPAFNQKNIEVKKEYKPNIPRLYLDPKKIQDVFGAIIQNAVEAMIDGGSISISIRQEKDYAAVCFADSGEGIPQNLCRRLEIRFSPLSRAH